MYSREQILSLHTPDKNYTLDFGIAKLTVKYNFPQNIDPIDLLLTLILNVYCQPCEANLNKMIEPYSKYELYIGHTHECPKVMHHRVRCYNFEWFLMHLIQKKIKGEHLTIKGYMTLAEFLNGVVEYFDPDQGKFFTKTYDSYKKQVLFKSAHKFFLPKLYTVIEGKKTSSCHKLCKPYAHYSSFTKEHLKSLFLENHVLSEKYITICKFLNYNRKIKDILINTMKINDMEILLNKYDNEKLCILLRDAYKISTTDIDSFKVKIERYKVKMNNLQVPTAPPIRAINVNDDNNDIPLLRQFESLINIPPMWRTSYGNIHKATAPPANIL